MTCWGNIPRTTAIEFRAVWAVAPFSGVRTVRGRPEGFLLTMDAIVLNCVNQFNIVWRVGTFPFLPMSKCLPKTRCVTVAEPLFKKNVSTANARCSSDQRCMMKENFKPLYPAMCVSLRHLHRCRHSVKFKSSNWFCPTLYLSQPNFRCRRTDSIVSLERGISSCAELQVFSCYRAWNEACHATREISTTSRP
jgi:hypothetical protein